MRQLKLGEILTEPQIEAVMDIVEGVEDSVERVKRLTAYLDTLGERRHQRPALTRTMTSQTDNQVKPGARTEHGAPVRLHGVVRAHPFRWKKYPSLKDGYGNRYGMICNGCNQTIIKGDYGNGTGERYFYISAESAAKEHAKNCRSVRKIIKAIAQVRPNNWRNRRSCLRTWPTSSNTWPVAISRITR